jgi:hypothetical protein
MHAKRLILGIALGVFLLVAIGCGWFLFGQTLRLSQIVNKQNDPYVTIAVNLFDFDTGLTRYDLYMLQSKARRWNMLIQTIERLPSEQQREYASAQLYAEIVSDPTARTALQKVAPFGNLAIVAFIKMLGQ